MKLFALGVVLMVVISGFWLARHFAFQSARKQNCLSTMVSIHFFGQLWANDHNGWMPRTLTEIGREFNLTRERIRQIEGNALRKLRRALPEEPQVDEAPVEH